jgi:anti-sigma-K factor RskA
MDYSRRELADRLASEYVLGTLRGPARRRFERLLTAHPGLRAAVAQWQERLLPLAQTVEPVEPSARVWAGIESRLFPVPPSGALSPGPTSWWRSLSLWRAFSGVAAAAVVALVVVGQQPPPTSAPIVVVLSGNTQVSQAVQGRFVASFSPDGRALVLRPIDAPPLTAQQALELWAVPATGSPRSLGLIKADGATTLLRERLLQDTAALAVSVEPSGGSPTGAPTGPIVSLGELKI